MKVQNLFSTTFVGLARQDHPLFDKEITAARFASYSHISISRRGIARGPIDIGAECPGFGASCGDDRTGVSRRDVHAA